MPGVSALSEITVLLMEVLPNPFPINKLEEFQRYILHMHRCGT